MSKSVRFVRKNMQGRVPMNFNWPGVIRSRLAVVNITAAEVIPGARSIAVGPNGAVSMDWIYHVGAANIWVSNVSPHFNDHFGGEPGGVEFILHVDFSSPLNVAITITVDDAIPIEVQN